MQLAVFTLNLVVDVYICDQICSHNVGMFTFDGLTYDHSSLCSTFTITVDIGRSGERTHPPNGLFNIYPRSSSPAIQDVLHNPSDIMADSTTVEAYISGTVTAVPKDRFHQERKQIIMDDVI